MQEQLDMPRIAEDRLLPFALHYLQSLACVAGAEGCAGAAEHVSDCGGRANVLLPAHQHSLDGLARTRASGQSPRRIE